jgi:lipoate-protein ligase A
VLWRLLHSSPLDGPDNMGLDEALMARARRTGETVLRTYAWSVPTLSLGRNQRACGLYEDAALRAAGITVVRRPTGGRALLHHREITYSVTAPVGLHESAAQAYAWINALLINALMALGAPVRAAARGGRPSRPTALPCFAEPAAGELAYEGRKLVGSAQWRDDGALLQHGSILVDDDQAMIPALMRVPPPPGPPPATLRGILGRAPSGGEMQEALTRALEALSGQVPQPLDLEPDARRDAERFADRYRDPVWTWRR